MRLFILFVLCFVLSSCSDLGKKEQLARIDGLMDRADSLSKILHEDTSDLEESLRLYTDSIRSMLGDVDTLDSEIADEIDTYFRFVTNAHKQISRVEICRNELITRMEQLKHLRRQIRQQEGRRDLYNEHIQFEREQLEDLNMEIEQVLEQRREVVENSRAYSESIIEKLRNFSALTEE